MILAWLGILVKEEMTVLAAEDVRKFDVHCNAGAAGELRVGAESLSVKIGQRVRMDDAEGMWHSVWVYAEQDENGSLVIRVLVSNPDWDEPLQIACITSRPGDGDCQTALGCNLDHVPP
jgi:hypothetical protein